MTISKLHNVPDVSGTSHVRIQVDIIGVNVVLHRVLVYPIDLRSPNDIYSETKYTVYNMVSTDSAMIRIMLNVEA